MEYQGYLDDAMKAVAATGEEYEESLRKGYVMKLRDACEKAWLAVLKATDALLEAHGLGHGETYEDRRNKLRELGEKEGKVVELGLYDRFQARMMDLHLQGFYDGDITPKQFKEEAQKVYRYIKDIEELVERPQRKD